MPITVSVEGLEQVDQQLARIGVEVRGKALTTAIRRAANRGKRSAIEAAPRGWQPEGEFPRLDVSIKTKIVERTDRITAIIGPDSKARHGHLVEYGHRMVVGGKLNAGGRVVGFVEARPWFRPSRDRVAPEVEKIFLEALRKAVDRLAAKGFSV